MANQFLTADEFAATAERCIEDQAYLATIGKPIEEKKRFKAQMMWAFGGMMGGFPPEEMPASLVDSVEWDEAAIAARNANKAA